MKIPPRTRHDSLDLDSAMTPMIDVVFLLLVFFVWTMSFRQIEMLLSSNLSKEAGKQKVDVQSITPEVDFDKIVIRILENPAGATFQIKDIQLKTIQDVEKYLEPIREIQPNAPIVIHPDSTAPMGPIVGVVDMTRTLGFEKVSFAINP